MLSTVHQFVKCLPKAIQHFKQNASGKLIYQTANYSTTTEPSDVEVIDVNIDEMMNEDSHLASNHNSEPPTPELTTITDLDGAPLAPFDVDPWVDEETAKQGTVDMEYIEEYRDEIKLPEPPTERSGLYKFDGLKVWLPQKMLSPSTYRYRLDEGEEESIPDDIRVCKFEKSKTTSSD